MEQQEQTLGWSRDDQLTTAIVVVVCVLLYFTSLHSYLLFHSLAEMVFIVVCLSVLVVAWSLRQFLDDDFALFLGIALAAVAVLHGVHVVDYPGLDLIGGSQDPPTQLWLSSRFLLAAALIASTFVIGRRVRLWVVVAACAGYVLLLLGSIYWWRIFPATLAAGTGLTPFKKLSEYVICLLFVLAAYLLWRKRSRLPHQTWRMLGVALVASIVAELWFTLYRSVDSWPNLMGHLFLVVSAILLFRAVVDDGLARPHAIAVHNLSEAELMHRRLEQALVPSVPVEHEGLHVVTSYRASERHLELSGDFIDVLDRGDSGVAVVCGDVSGHGPNAAAMGAMLRASWQALIDSGATPAAIVASLRAVLERERKNPLTFATLCLAWIDPRRNEVSLLNLGHPPPLLVDEDAVPLSARPMPPLGSIEWPVEEPVSVPLPDGWRLFFYTDGLIEGRVAPRSPERYGEGRLIEAVRRHLCGKPAGARELETLLVEVESAGGEPFADDVTVMLFSQADVPSGLI